jgi:hypothetical protein
MPIHDWTRVRANRFHDFHQSWTIALRNALNAGRLPPGYFATVEQKEAGPNSVRLDNCYVGLSTSFSCPLAGKGLLKTMAVRTSAIRPQEARDHERPLSPIL